MGIFISTPLSIKDHCESNHHWRKIVQSVNNAREWSLVTKHMFDDDIVHEARLEVLRYFTESVVDRLKRNGLRKEALEIADAHVDFSASLQPADMISL